MSAINEFHERKGNMTAVEFDSAKFKEKAHRLHEFMEELTEGPIEAISLLAFVLEGYKEATGLTDVIISESRPQ